jgi:hypothetical protein
MTNWARNEEIIEAVRKGLKAMADSKAAGVKSSRKGVRLGEIAYILAKPQAKVREAVERQIGAGHIINLAEKPNVFSLILPA